KRSVLSSFQFAPILSYHSGLPFNLLAGGEVNGKNHTNNQRPIGAPRGSRGCPSFFPLYMRFVWQHKSFERANLQFFAEGFNVANHTNYSRVNNVVGPLFGFTPGFTNFDVHGSQAISPTRPLGFTSALPKREIQLGMRFSF